MRARDLAVFSAIDGRVDTRIFLPGWGASAGTYAPGLPPGWGALQPPRFRAAGRFDDFRCWLRDELRRRQGPIVLAGHSMGGALALLAAVDHPSAVSRLVLFSPALLPLTKPMPRSGAAFAAQVACRRLPLRHAARAAAGVAQAPRAALRVASDVRHLDLTREMRAIAAAGVPVTVVGCASDTLVTAASCRNASALLGADYRELSVPGGHMWMLGHWPTFRDLLRD